MSVERVTGRGLPWRVRWRDQGGHPRSKRVRTRELAERLDRKLKEDKALAVAGLASTPAQRVALRDFVLDVWWQRYALPNYAETTRRARVSCWNAQINPYLGALRLCDITVSDVEEWQATLTEKGYAATTRMNALMLLSSILSAAVRWDYLQANPVSRVVKPKPVRDTEAHVLAPASVEALRARLSDRGALAVSLTAYAGVRPREARGLRWDHIRQRTLYVPAAIAKTRKARTVRLWQPLIDDLDAWRGNESPTILGWSTGAYDHWRDKEFGAACTAIGLEGYRFYDLRHSFVSLLIQSGANILDIARQAGHRPVETLQTYGHLFDEYEPDHRIDPEQEIVSVRCPPEPESA